jgi:hypothetical protein
VKNNRAKLTPEKVWEILASNESNQILAKRFGVWPDTIARIRRRVAWKQVELKS